MTHSHTGYLADETERLMQGECVGLTSEARAADLLARPSYVSPSYVGTNYVSPSYVSTNYASEADQQEAFTKGATASACGAR